MGLVYLLQVRNEQLLRYIPLNATLKFWLPDLKFNGPTLHNYSFTTGCSKNLRVVGGPDLSLHRGPPVSRYASALVEGRGVIMAVVLGVP